MSKIVAGTAFVLLSGATVTGGVLLSKASKQTTDETNAPAEPTYDAEIAQTLDTFKTDGHNEGCVQKLFKGVTSLPTDTSTASTDNVDQNFFGSGKKTEGCLVVNWNKKTKTAESNTTWSGNFRFLWAVKGEGSDGTHKGFIVFLAGKTPDSGSEKELKWEGIVYVLKSTGTDNNRTWTAEYQQKVGSSDNKSFKKDGSTDVSNQFPRAGDSLTDLNNKAFWDFISETNDLDKIAVPATGETPQPTESSMKGHWEWDGQQSNTDVTNKKKMSTWTKDLGTWWPKVFADNKFKANEWAEKQYGTWTKRVYEVLPKTSSNGKGS